MAITNKLFGGRGMDTTSDTTTLCRSPPVCFSRGLRLVALIGAAAVALVSMTATATPLYRLTDVGQLYGFSGTNLFDINESGQAVGSSVTSITSRNAVLYSGAALLDLGVMSPFASSRAQGINDQGLVVGTAQNYQGNLTRGFVYDSGVTADLGTLGGDSSQAIAISNAGQVTGQAQTAGNLNRHAFIYSNGSMVDLGALTGHTSTGSDINNSGQVVGTYFSGGNGVGGFFYNSGTMTDLSSFGAFLATGINDFGQITGMSYGRRAHVFDGGVMQLIGTFGGSQSSGSGITRAAGSAPRR